MTVVKYKISQNLSSISRTIYWCCPILTTLSVCTVDSCLQQTITEPLSILHQQDWLYWSCSVPTTLSVYHKILQNLSLSSSRRTKNWSCPVFTPLCVCSIYTFVYRQYSHFCLYAVLTPLSTCSIHTFVYMQYSHLCLHAVFTPLSTCNIHTFVCIQYLHHCL